MHMTFSLLVLLLLFSSSSSIAAEQLAAQSGDLAINAIRYVEDTEQQLDMSAAMQRLQAPPGDGDVMVQSGHVFNLGLTHSRYWLMVDFHNHKQSLRELRLLVSAAYRPLLKVYLLRDAKAPQLILEDSHARHFGDRNNDYRYLNSSVFELAGDESASLLIQYHTIGSSYLPLSLRDAASFNNIMFEDSVDAAFFYSFSLAAIAVFLLFALAMMDKNSAMYALLLSIGLLFIASMEGYAFKYLWPQWPQWNHLSPLFLQYLLTASGLLVSHKAAIHTARNKKILKAIWYLAIGSFVLMLLSLVLPFVTMAKIASPLLGLMFVSQGYALASWISMGKKRNAVAIVAGVLLAVFVSMIVLLSLDVSILPGYFYVYSTRVVYLIASLATMATIIAHVSGLRLDHEKALENELRLSKREAEANRALYEAEQNYSRVRELAHFRRQQLATASHDMRQPLTSLRSTIDAIAHNEPEAIKNQLRNAFDYLQNLCSNYLRDTRPDDRLDEPAGSNHGQDDERQGEQHEPYSASLILQTAARMFKNEAEDKGLQFRQRSCSVTIAEPPLVLMRIVTNLVSNAVKHTREGRVLLGARRRADGLCIQVYDSGSGMSTEQLARLGNAYEKGPESSGEGLGLAICRQLAEQHGMRLDIRSALGRGTCCSLYIPRVN